jgi:aminoglycoside phosphotransferase (APT) family kinase protein
MELIASGRDSDIYAFAPGLVLRRARSGRSLVDEARVMEHARQHGCPVPAVDHVSDDGTDIVMERVDGPSMVDAIGRRPWSLGRHAATLADLHREVHAVPAPAWLAPAPGPEGDVVVHLDLHPLNVIIGARGPVLIDWSNAARGDADLDVALTWVLLASGGIPEGAVMAHLLGWGRGLFVNAFLRHVDTGAARARLRAAVAWKLGDEHMTPAEQAAMRRLAERHSVL